MARLVANGSRAIIAEITRLKSSGLRLESTIRAQSRSQIFSGDEITVGQWYGTRLIMLIAPPLFQTAGHEIFFIEGNKLFSSSERDMATDRFYSEINSRITFARWIETGYMEAFYFVVALTGVGQTFEMSVNTAFSLAFYSNNYARINRLIPLIPGFLRAARNFMSAHPQTAQIIFRGIIRETIDSKIRELNVLIGLQEQDGSTQKRLETMMKLVIKLWRLKTFVRNSRIEREGDNTMAAVIKVFTSTVVKRINAIIASMSNFLSSGIQQLRSLKNMFRDTIRANFYYPMLDALADTITNPGMVREAAQIISANGTSRNTRNISLSRLLEGIKNIAEGLNTTQEAVLKYTALLQKLRTSLSNCQEQNSTDIIPRFTAQDYHAILHEIVDMQAAGNNTLHEIERHSNRVLIPLLTLSNDFEALKRSYHWGRENALAGRE